MPPSLTGVVAALDSRPINHLIRSWNETAVLSEVRFQKGGTDPCIIAWFTILIVGRYPRGLFTFVGGTIRWTYRVYCYAIMLTTDRYPPFRLGP